MSGMDFGFGKSTIVQSTFYNRQMQMNRFDIEPTDIVKILTLREPENFENITKEYFDARYTEENQYCSNHSNLSWIICCFSFFT